MAKSKAKKAAPFVVPPNILTEEQFAAVRDTLTISHHASRALRAYGSVKFLVTEATAENPSQTLAVLRIAKPTPEVVEEVNSLFKDALTLNALERQRIHNESEKTKAQAAATRAAAAAELRAKRQSKTGPAKS